jgi:hypothetical protein
VASASPLQGERVRPLFLLSVLGIYAEFTVRVYGE